MNILLTNKKNYKFVKKNVNLCFFIYFFFKNGHFSFSNILKHFLDQLVPKNMNLSKKFKVRKISHQFKNQRISIKFSPKNLPYTSNQTSQIKNWVNFRLLSLSEKLYKISQRSKCRTRRHISCFPFIFSFIMKFWYEQKKKNPEKNKGELRLVQSRRDKIFI